MAHVLRTIDADSHVCEPPNLWEDYIDPKFRDSCPKMWADNEGGQHFRIDDKQAIVTYPGDPFSIAAAGFIGARDGTVSMMGGYEDGEPGGADPHARIAWMDKEEIDGTIIFPTMLLAAMQAITEPDRAVAVADAYDRWLKDFCSAYPDRLFGVGTLPLISIEGAIAQVKKAKKLGFNAGFVRPNPVLGRPLHSPDYYPLWEVCQDLDFAIGVHGSTGMENMGMDRFSARPLIGGIETMNVNPSVCVQHCFTHIAEMMAAITSFVMAGVCDKFPRLRVGFMEAGGGWVPAYIERMDRHFDDISQNDTKLSMRPSEIFRRQCFASFEPIETSLKYLAEYLGPDSILWASDYPHGDGFPRSVKLIRDMNMKPELEAAVFCQGAKRFYGLA